jgi:beta-lactamase superfamily II metal-dependent hydrolase
LTGDGIGTDIVKELSRLKLLENKRIHVDILKVPHHGSNRNSDEEFFTTVTADTYVISANTRHGNPDPEVLRMIANQAKKDKRHFKLVCRKNAQETQKRGI